MTAHIPTQAPRPESGELVRSAHLDQDLTVARWDALAGTANGLVSVHGPDGRCRHVAAPVTAMLGYTPDEIVGQHPGRLIHPDDGAAVARRFARMQTELTTTRMILRLRRHNGSWAWTDVAIHPIVLDGVLAEFVTVTRDLTPGANPNGTDDHVVDPTTGLANQSALERCLRDSVEPAHLILIELDAFKALNVSRGRSVGDQVLTEYSHRLLDVAGDALVARMGGGVFAVLTTGTSSTPDVPMDLALAIKRLLDAPILCEPTELVRLTASIGVASTQVQDAKYVDDLYSRAEAALTHAQALGRGHLAQWSPAIPEAAAAHTDAEQALRSALASNGITLAYMPIVRVTTGIPVAVEALVRFSEQPINGGAAALISAARAAGLTAKVDQIVARLVRQDLAQIVSAYPTIERIHVNAAADSLTEIAWQAEIANFPVGEEHPRLVVEVTEDTLLAAGSAGALTLASLRDSGYLVALDDFGAGYTSLGTLASIPVDLVKLDRSLVTGAGTDPRRRAVLAGALEIAHGLQLPVVAEGVETDADQQMLYVLGAAEAQGWLHGKPERPFAAPAA